MKLVAALCPNCKSNLKVNPKNETIKCEYCGSAILIEEAIETYGKVIELDPNNKDGILKYGICKTLLNNYVDFSLEY